MPDSKKSTRPFTELAQEQPLLIPPSRFRRMVFILVLGPPGHEEHWTSVQWDEAFDEVIVRLKSVVQKCAYTVRLSQFVRANLLKYLPWDHTRPTILRVRFQYSQSLDHHVVRDVLFWSARQLECLVPKRSSFFLAGYIMAIPLSLTYFIILSQGMLGLGFSSENIAYRLLGALSLVAYVSIVGTSLTGFRKRGTRSGFKPR
ncbi:hypothetical protein AZE42_08990 [Rhizopogon vesiculosus]|uniref:Uncharacterized protein n=1 Tax=Rhizopogon vesiculosus TaxID=180088 RepID=A0A1J8R5P7_9AGAM|nr:hypothetical protein AZE42_08990 [Rhizopogon vesiculosus]